MFGADSLKLESQTSRMYVGHCHSHWPPVKTQDKYKDVK